MAEVPDCLLRGGGRLSAASVALPPRLVPAAPAKGHQLTVRTGPTAARRTCVYLFGVKHPPSGTSGFHPRRAAGN